MPDEQWWATFFEPRRILLNLDFSECKATSWISAAATARFRGCGDDDRQHRLCHRRRAGDEMAFCMP